jgi:hypothetical protein
MSKRRKSTPPKRRKGLIAKLRKARARLRRGKARKRDGLLIKKRRPGISDVRLQRGLIVLRKSKDIAAAAKAARTTPERFRRAALKKRTIRRLGTGWAVRRDLAFELPLFTDGKSIVVTVRTLAAARLAGRYMSAVGHFVRTNDPTFLDPFVDRSVTDTSKTKHEFETRPNVLYRLTLSESETFEQVYRIVV